MQRIGSRLMPNHRGLVRCFKSKASTSNFSNTANKNTKKVLYCIAVGTTTSGLMYYTINYNQQKLYAENSAERFSEEEEKPQSTKWTLYQYATCPFCCKVRAYLDFYGVEYDIVEVNPIFRNEIKFSEYRKVPILKSGDVQLNDSSLIISVLKSKRLGKGDLKTLLTYYPVLESKNEKGKKVLEYQNRYNLMYQGGMGQENHEKIREEQKWRSWVDHTFVHTLSPNIYRTLKESFQAMEYITHVGNFSNFERQLVYYSGALAMYVIGRRIKRRHNLRKDVRESLYSEAHFWMKAIGKKRQFLGGNVPNLADLNMYGVINAIEGLEAFHDLMKNTNIGPWYTRMKKQVNSHAGATQPDWLVGEVEA